MSVSFEVMDMLVQVDKIGYSSVQEFLLKKKKTILLFFYLRCIKLIKSVSKDIYNVAKNFDFI